MNERKRGAKRRIWSFVAGMVLVAGLTVAVVFVTLNYGAIQDYFAGMGYEPVAEMARIRDELGLSAEARRVFDATWPELDERGDFNRNCRSGEVDVAILGCYAGGRIYVYDIVNEELDGVRELATAHELLHAMWERLGVREQAMLTEELEAVLAENEWLAEELAIYEEGERESELYARVGTEVRELPERLLAHYAEMIAAREQVVAYYEGYIGVFRAVEERLAEIESELVKARAALDAEVAEYERRAEQFAADVVSFNACAAVEGCLKSKWEGDSRRAALIQEQAALVARYDEINAMVDEVNALIGEYNSNVLHGQMLNDAVNSLVVPEGV